MPVGEECSATPECRGVCERFLGAMMGETGGYGIEDIESIRSDQPAKVCAKMFHGGVGLAMLGCEGAWCELGRGGGQVSAPF